jgi:hypothetical protein
MFIIWAGTIFARVLNFGTNLSAFLLTHGIPDLPLQPLLQVEAA